MQQRRKIATHCDDRHRRDHSRNSNRTCARKGSPAYDKCFLLIHYAIFEAQIENIGCLPKPRPFRLSCSRAG